MKCIITIELGTNAVRVLAFDLNGKVIGSMKGHYPTFHSHPNYSEQDPEQVFITMLYVLKNLLTEKLHPQKHKVATICFSSSMHSLLAVDKKGIPLGYAMTWADNRAKNEAIELKNSESADLFYRSTGTPIHPMSPVFKIQWMLRNDKERFQQAARFLSLKSYIIYQLTGEYLIDHSIASATGLLNINTIKWNDQSLQLAGIKADKLPDLVGVFSSAGKLKKAYQNSLGISDDTKIIIGSSDGCLASLGAGILNTNKATITIEDSGAVRVMGKKTIYDQNNKVFNYLLTENYFVSGGPTNNGGVIFEWFAKQFGDFSIAYDIETSMESLIEQASKVELGSRGLIFLPYLLGERAPIWNADARGVYFGMNINHERQHFIRATLEGILYEILSIGKMLSSHRNIDSLCLNGSFASIPFCAQMIADMYNKPVSVAQQPQSVGQGAFLLSATEMGIFKNLDEAAQTISETVNYSPQLNHHKSYMAGFSIFERLSFKLAEEFEAIADWQQE